MGSGHRVLRCARTWRAVRRRLVSIVSAAGTYSHAIPAMQEAAAVLMAGLVFADK